MNGDLQIDCSSEKKREGTDMGANWCPTSNKCELAWATALF